MNKKKSQMIFIYFTIWERRVQMDVHDQKVDFSVSAVSNVLRISQLKC
jgi:hypothetical protein